MDHLLILFLFAVVVVGQKPARIGDDGKPLLNRSHHQTSKGVLESGWVGKYEIFCKPPICA